MSFKIIIDRRFSCPIVVSVPSENGVQQQQFTACFVEMGQQSLRQLVNDGDNDGKNGDVRLLDAVLVGWRDIVDEHDQPLPFDDHWKKRMIDIPYIRAALLKAYIEALAGAASEKNSSVPSVTS